MVRPNVGAGRGTVTVYLQLFSDGSVDTEYRRVVRLGGVVRVAMPDLRRPARLYLEGHGPCSLTADRAHIRDASEGTRASPRCPAYAVHPLDRADHLWMYDAESLSTVLREAGFAEPRERAFRDCLMPEVAHFDPADRATDSVCVEARL